MPPVCGIWPCCSIGAGGGGGPLLRDGGGMAGICSGTCGCDDGPAYAATAAAGGIAAPGAGGPGGAALKKKMSAAGLGACIGPSAGAGAGGGGAPAEPPAGAKAALSPGGGGGEGRKSSGTVVFEAGDGDDARWPRRPIANSTRTTASAAQPAQARATRARVQQELQQRSPPRARGTLLVGMASLGRTATPPVPTGTK